MTNRWWIYQRERFPILAHVPMVAIFCLSIMLFSSMQSGELPGIGPSAGAVITTIILFFQLRVADEHKDFDDDATFRPHRAVPRGLVALPELARIARIGAAIQFVIAVSIDVGLVPILFAVWLYMVLMTKEFFAVEWLRKTPSVYLASHMLVMPLIAFYVSAFDWLCACREVPAGLAWLLLFSFASGLVLELGRKIKTPDAERTGVETYSAVWGVRVAMLAWIAASGIAVVSFVKATTFLAGTFTVSAVATAALAFGLVIAASVMARKRPLSSTRLVEPGSGIFAMLLYLGLGPLHLFLA